MEWGSEEKENWEKWNGTKLQGTAVEAMKTDEALEDSLKPSAIERQETGDASTDETQIRT